MTKSGAVKLEPVEVQHVKLRRGLLGYERGGVDQLLEDVTSSYEEVWLERDRLRAEAERLREELELSRARERQFGDVLLDARMLAERTVAEARESADALLREAQENADELTKQARAEPERVQQEIRRLQEAESGLRARLRALVAEVHKLLDDESRSSESRTAEAPRDAAATGTAEAPRDAAATGESLRALG